VLTCVVDPGVLVAARLSGKGAPAELIHRWLGGRLDIIVSPLLLAELDRVLDRGKFRRWLTREEAREYIKFLRTHARLEADPPPTIGHTRDPGDDYLVTLARAVRARVLVSGDSDLTEIVDPRPPVLTPREVVDMLDRIEQ
jgi:uncharacterized protein